MLPRLTTIKTSSLSYRYPSSKRSAIEDVNLRTEEGDFIALIGRSGCGKSTLLRCLTGLIPQASEGEMKGRVEICGLDTRSQSLPKLATLANIVFQDPEIGFFCSTVEDEIAFGPKNLGLSKEEVGRRVEFVLESTRIAHLRKRRLVDLSGGEKQRIAIASVLSMKPKILVLDEPTSDLDSAGARSIIGVLQSLRTQHGMTVVVAEHRLDDLSHYLNRIVVMDKGRVVAEGSPQDILVEKRKLLEVLGIVPSSAAGEVCDDTLMTLGIRMPFSSPVIGKVGCSGLCELKKDIRCRDAILKVSGVSFSYPFARQVLRDVSFEIGRGELVALLGANGVGKTTLAHLIAGLLKSCQGSISLDGVGKLNGKLAQRVGLLFQNPSRQLFCDSARQEVEFGPKNMHCADFSERGDRMLKVFGIDQYAELDPHHLSEGEKQRLATASILSARPDLLILDEPTTGQDWGHLETLMKLLQANVEEGMSVLLITHDDRLARHYASRVMVMRDGRRLGYLSLT